MIYKHLLLILFLIISISGYSQKISNIDFADVKSKVTNKNSEYFYPILIQKFNHPDSSLTAEDVKYLYYGYVFQRNYRPYGTSGESEKEFYGYYETKNFTRAIPIAERLLERNPVNLTLLAALADCYFSLKNEDKFIYYNTKLLKFIEIIYSSGSGKSREDAWVVVAPNDQYLIFSDLGVEIAEHTLMGDTDYYTIKQPNKNNIKELYFNIRIPLIYVNRQFDKQKVD